MATDMARDDVADDDVADDDPGRPLRDWQRAVVALRAAEVRRAEHAEIICLSNEVIRSRNDLTLDRIQAGWNAPDDILRHLSVDDQLLREQDDTALPACPSSVPHQRAEPPRP